MNACDQLIDFAWAVHCHGSCRNRDPVYSIKVKKKRHALKNCAPNAMRDNGKAGDTQKQSRIYWNNIKWEKMDRVSVSVVVFAGGRTFASFHTVYNFHDDIK